jgi:hypothetical protein
LSKGDKNSQVLNRAGKTCSTEQLNAENDRSLPLMPLRQRVYLLMDINVIFLIFPGRSFSLPLKKKRRKHSTN